MLSDFYGLEMVELMEFILSLFPPNQSEGFFFTSPLPSLQINMALDYQLCLFYHVECRHLVYV